jgi:anaerobic magnesium-protoporphyrin IX monomethyl ester cyclase
MTRIALYVARFSNTPFKLYPLGVSYIRSYLIQEGLASEEEVRIFDSLEETLDFRPDIVGVSSTSQVLGNARRFAAECKAQLGCLTVLGGYHIGTFPESLPAEFDVGVVGEGEISFSELLQAFVDNMKSFEGIPGLCYWSDGQVLVTPARPLIEDLDELPLPGRHRIYSDEAPIFTSRGCPYRCAYCAGPTFWNHRYRTRSAQPVVEEIRQLVDTEQPREIAILDDLWIADKRRFREIVETLCSLGIPGKASFRGFCRSNIVEEEDIVLLKRLNYGFVRFGAETGSESLLKRLKGRSASISHHQKLIELCARHGLTCKGSFMFGVPGEHEEDLQATWQFLKSNRGRLGICGFYYFTLVPGTPIWMEMMEAGTVPENYPWEDSQLDMLNPGFDWVKAEQQYLNADRIPFPRFKNYIEQVRKEFF